MTGDALETTALLALVRSRLHELRRLELLGVGGLDVGRRRQELGELRERLAQLVAA